MAFEPIELTLVGENGHTGKFSYSLADEGGWDVRAELDNCIVATCHCQDWHKVERMCTRLEMQLRLSPSIEGMIHGDTGDRAAMPA